ncbi:MAG: ABC transporter family substrate-binding protein [Mobilicoccus sp.]|nr:ABC transporter family substrate-binding protein [Mobilicoccus sp.]
MMKNRRMQLALAAAMSGALLLSACADGGNGGGGSPGDNGTAGGDNGAAGTDSLDASNPQDRDALQQGGELNLPMESFPTNFNGWHVDGNLSAWSTVTNATDPMMFLYSPEGEVSNRPEFLTEMPTTEEVDGKPVVTYNLNPDAVWNDGTKIDWTAFEATWKANRAPVDKEQYNNIANAGYEDIESVEQGDNENQVKVTFARPFFPITQVFSGLVHPKLGESPEAFNDTMKEDVHSELRSGPFKIESIDKTAQTIVLTPNEKWWGDAPMLDQIVYRQMEPSADIPAFRNGEIDMVGLGNKARYDQAAGAPNMEIRQSQRLTTRVFVYNSEATALSDVNVRKAMWQGMNVEELKSVQYSGMDYEEEPVGSYLYFNFQEEAENNVPVEFDVEAARQTLTDAGYTENANNMFEKDGQPLQVRYTAFGDDPITSALAQTIQTQMQAIGIDLEIDIRSGAQFGETMEQRTFDFLGMAWSSGSPSPVTGLCQIMCSDSSSNYAQVGTPELDERMKAIGSIEDAGEQAAEMNAIEKEWLEQYGQRPWTNGPAMGAYRTGLANLGPAAFASLTPKWENVGWEQN